MEKFQRLVLEEFRDWPHTAVWTYVLANGLWLHRRKDVPQLNRASLTLAVRLAGKQLALDGYLTATPPLGRGYQWEFALTDAGRDELNENNTHCLLCEKLIKAPFATGLAIEMGCDWGFEGDRRHGSPISAFATLWDHINGAGEWDKNPWVSALTFEARHVNIDRMESDNG